MTETKIIVRNKGPAGPEHIIAPKGWTYDTTAIEAWYWLLVATQQKDFRRQRDKFTTEAKIEVLAQVLANSLGMAGTYWILAAREIVAAGDWRTRG